MKLRQRLTGGVGLLKKNNHKFYVVRVVLSLTTSILFVNEMRIREGILILSAGH